MPSWSPSTPQDTPVIPPELEVMTAVERVRRLLMQLLTAREPVDPPARPDN